MNAVYCMQVFMQWVFIMVLLAGCFGWLRLQIEWELNAYESKKK